MTPSHWLVTAHGHDQPISGLAGQAQNEGGVA